MIRAQLGLQVPDRLLQDRLTGRGLATCLERFAEQHPRVRQLPTLCSSAFA